MRAAQEKIHMDLQGCTPFLLGHMVYVDDHSHFTAYRSFNRILKSSIMSSDSLLTLLSFEVRLPGAVCVATTLMTTHVL